MCLLLSICLCKNDQISSCQCFIKNLTGRYLRYIFDTLFLQQLLIKPLGLLWGHVGLISGEEANFICVRPLPMWQGTVDRIKHQCRRFSCEKTMKALAVVCSVLQNSHANCLGLFGDLPEREEQADLLSLVQEQGVTRGLSFQKSLQSLDGLFHLTETLTLELKTTIKTHRQTPFPPRDTDLLLGPLWISFVANLRQS